MRRVCGHKTVAFYPRQERPALCYPFGYSTRKGIIDPSSLAVKEKSYMRLPDVRSVSPNGAIAGGHQRRKNRISTPGLL